MLAVERARRTVREQDPRLAVEQDDADGKGLERPPLGALQRLVGVHPDAEPHRPHHVRYQLLEEAKLLLAIRALTRSAVQAEAHAEVGLLGQADHGAVAQGLGAHDLVEECRPLQVRQRQDRVRRHHDADRTVLGHVNGPGIDHMPFLEHAKAFFARVGVVLEEDGAVPDRLAQQHARDAVGRLGDLLESRHP